MTTQCKTLKKKLQKKKQTSVPFHLFDFADPLRTACGTTRETSTNLKFMSDRRVDTCHSLASARTLLCMLVYSHSISCSFNGRAVDDSVPRAQARREECGRLQMQNVTYKMNTHLCFLFLFSLLYFVQAETRTCVLPFPSD